MARFEKSRPKSAKPHAAVATSRRASTAPSIEDTMFFPRLRRHAKWMFVLLALVFGLGFVLFGVGAGGVGVGDIFRDASGTSAQSVSDAREKTEELAREENLRYVHSANEPDLVHGVGTAALETLEQEKGRIDAIVVPIGLGSGISGTITVVRALRPEIEVIGVQAANAPAVCRSFKEGRIVKTETADTVADGLPAYLLLLDGLIMGDPENSALLLSAARLYGTYAGGFVADSERVFTFTTAAIHAKSMLPEIERMIRSVRMSAA